MNKPLLKIEYIPFSQLKECKKPAQKYSEELLLEIANAIEKYGFVKPLLINEKKEVIADYGHFLAAEILDIESIPCIQLDNFSAFREGLFSILDTLFAQNVKWDESALIKRLEHLEEAGFNLEALGFDEEGLLSNFINYKPTEAVTKVCNVEEISTLLLLTDRRIQQLANEGVIIKLERGRYDLIKSVQSYIKYLNEQIPHKKTEGSSSQYARVDAEVERAKLLKHKAELARLEEEEKKGILINKEDKEREMAAIALGVQQGLLSIPIRVAQDFAIANDAAEIIKQLELEIIDALSEMSDMIKSGKKLAEKSKLAFDEEQECEHWRWFDG